LTHFSRVAAKRLLVKAEFPVRSVVCLSVCPLVTTVSSEETADSIENSRCRLG